MSDAAALPRPDVATRPPLLVALQRLNVQKKLVAVLEHALGAPKVDVASGKREDYMRIAAMLLAKYDAAASLLKSWGGDVCGAPRRHLMLRAAFVMLTNGDEISSLRNLEDALPEVERGFNGGGDDEEWLLSGVTFAEAFTIVDTHLSVDLAAEVLKGVEMLRVDEEVNRMKEDDRQRATAAAVRQRTAAVALNPEDRYMLGQLTRAGVEDLLRDRVPQLGDNEGGGDFESVEVEVTFLEPRFLKGHTDWRRRKSDFQLARESQRDAVFAQNKSMLPAHVRLLQKDREQRREEAMGEKGKSSMDLSAVRQQQHARERRELRQRQRRMQQEQDAAVVRDGDPVKGQGEVTERTTRAAAGFTNTDLDEGVQEQGIRGRADLPPGAIPPWLLGAGDAKGGPSTRGGPNRNERGGMAWGIQTDASIEEQRANLPIARHKALIVETVKANQITVLVGETGSGKTTQLPQYLCEAGFGERGIIACTQPRRVAATSLAERVSVEYGCRLGEEVGYSVRFLDRTSKITKIKYLTDGMLLREALGDETFGRYSVIILDEAHERSLNTDVLFGLVKAAVRKRPDLRVVVTSATLDTNKFCEYFGTPTPLIFEGRTHPVDTKWHDAPVEDYVEETINTVMSIHLTMPPGDILCFLTGQDEIESVAERLHEFTTSEELEGIPPLIITVIFGALPQENQSVVFEPTPKGSRKVVLATNIAETSITIDGVFFVIDCGFCKQNVFNPKTGAEQLTIVPVSRQQAKQRAGRAGRTGPGVCYHLFTKAQYDELPEASIPEIQRTNLINVALTLKATGVVDLLTFDFLDPPNKEALVTALEKLFHLGALDEDGVLTEMGSRMSELPLEPMQCKTLLTAVDLGCASNVLSVVSMLSTQEVFYRPRHRQEEADLRRARFTAPEGDQLTLLAVYDAWVAAGASAEWCTENFVQFRSLRDAREIRNQLERILSRRAGGTASETGVLGPEQGSRDLDLVRKALAAGYFFQAAKRESGGDYRTLSDKRKVALHPSSTLAHTRPRYVVYHELIVTGREYIRNAMMIDPRWLTELAPNYYSTPAEGQLTREQRAERLVPKLRRQELGNDWRISRQRVPTRR